MAVWSEELHPRGEHGRWTFSNAGGWALDEDDQKLIERYGDGANLAPAEITADKIIRAVDDYRVFGSVAINKMLRGGGKPDSQTRYLDMLTTENSLSENVILHRYFRADSGNDQWMADIKPGDTIVDRGFMSTTLIPHSAWRPGAKVEFKEMQILADAGSKAAYLGELSFADEQEVLLPRNSKLEYVGEGADGARVFKLRQDQISVRSTSEIVTDDSDEIKNIAEKHGVPWQAYNSQEPIYLRIGAWDPNAPRSKNFATGDIEAGLSVYDLDADGKPIAPEESEWAEQDLQDRLASNAPKFLVQGMLVGQGHDGEPLLDKPAVVGLHKRGYIR